ncbi:hypothetical protein TNCV_1268281, partial [Trichonephila clavipes]
YPGMEMQPTNVTVVTPPQVFGKEPTQVTCGNCKNVVVTVTIYQDGGCVYMSAILLFCFCLPFTFLPFITYPCCKWNGISGKLGISKWHR